MPPASALSPSGAWRTPCWARRWGENVQWGMKAWSGNRRWGDLPMNFKKKKDIKNETQKSEWKWRKLLKSTCPTGSFTCPGPLGNVIYQALYPHQVWKYISVFQCGVINWKSRDYVRVIWQYKVQIYKSCKKKKTIGNYGPEMYAGEKTGEKWEKLTLQNLKKYGCYVAPNHKKNLNTLMPRQNGCHFADDISKCIFLNENVWIPIKISLKFVPEGPINNIPALV